MSSPAATPSRTSGRTISNPPFGNRRSTPRSRTDRSERATTSRTEPTDWGELVLVGHHHEPLRLPHGQLQQV